MNTKNSNYDRDVLVLLNFLKSGLSTRQLDAYRGFDTKKSKGWDSWSILKKFGIKDNNKGILYVYSPKQAKTLIKLIIKDNHINVEDLIKQYSPETLSSYKNSFVITKNAESLYAIMKGETRNIIQGFFSPLKKMIGTCQHKECNITELETAHLTRDRIELFVEAANESKPVLIENNMMKFDLYEVMRIYLEKHKGKSVSFLCKKHHAEMDALRNKNKSKFKKYLKAINTK